MSPVTSHSLAEVFVEFADTLVAEFDLIEFLEMVTSRTSEIVNAEAAGLLLADQRGQLQFMAASNEQSRMVELFQAQAVEGPCQDCFRQGVPVINVDLRRAANRWPRFAPRASAAGFQAVHAFPLRLRDQVIGALNIFGNEPRGLSQQDVRITQALADVATIGLLQERAVRHGELLSEQLQSALNSRIVIEQAKGALAQTHHCTPDEALSLMRSFCRRSHRKLSEVALQCVNAPGEVSELTAPQR